MQRIGSCVMCFKFLATFLCPALYPTVVFAFGGTIAAFGPPPPGSEFSFVLNALAWIGVLTLLATLAVALKSLFGRQPSLTTILSGLVTVGALKEFKEEQHRRDKGLEIQISNVRHDVDEALNSALVRESTRENENRLTRDIVSRLQERTETHIRKLDQYDGKLDTLLATLARLTKV